MTLPAHLLPLLSLLLLPASRPPSLLLWLRRVPAAPKAAAAARAGAAVALRAGSRLARCRPFYG